MSRAVLDYMTSGRNPMTIAAMAVCACFLALAIADNAPWWFYPPVAFATMGSAYMVLFNPKSGLSIDHEQLRVVSGSWSRTVNLADLASISIVVWSDGPDTATANLKDGSSFTIPSVCIPKKPLLVDAARQSGIQLT